MTFGGGVDHVPRRLYNLLKESPLGLGRLLPADEDIQCQITYPIIHCSNSLFDHLNFTSITAYVGLDLLQDILHGITCDDLVACLKPVCHLHASNIQCFGLEIFHHVFDTGPLGFDVSVYVRVFLGMVLSLCALCHVEQFVLDNIS